MTAKKVPVQFFRLAISTTNLDTARSRNSSNHERPQQDRSDEPVAPEPLGAGDHHCQRAVRPRDQHHGPQGRAETAADIVGERGGFFLIEFCLEMRVCLLEGLLALQLVLSRWGWRLEKQPVLRRE
jgi:hypothetical protein